MLNILHGFHAEWDEAASQVASNEAENQTDDPGHSAGGSFSGGHFFGLASGAECHDWLFWPFSLGVCWS